MKYSDQSLGYPCLNDEGSAERDYPYKIFDPHIGEGVRLAESPMRYVIPYELGDHCSSEDLKQLIEDGKASYFIRVLCKSTYYNVLKKVGDSGTLEIPADDVSGEVVLEAFIAATQEFRYSSDEFHDDYSGLSFQIKPGNILAWPSSHKIYCSKENHTRTAGMFFFKSEKMPKNRFKVMPDPDDPYIYIYSCQATCDLFKSVAHKPNTDGYRIIVAMVLVPALAQMIGVLRKVMNPENKGKMGVDGEYLDKHWAKLVQQKCEQKGLDLENSERLCDLEIAQALFDDPLNKFEQQIKKEQQL